MMIQVDESRSYLSVALSSNRSKICAAFESTAQSAGEEGERDDDEDDDEDDESRMSWGRRRGASSITLNACCTGRAT